jgi:hypothetical protein
VARILSKRNPRDVLQSPELWATTSPTSALFPTENGSRIRLITNRPIRFKEAYVNGRTTDYDLSAIELNLSKEKRDSDGSLIVAARFKTDKDKQIVLEATVLGRGAY